MLIGKKVVLRAPHDADLPQLAKMRNNLDLQLLLMSQPRPNTIARVSQWLTDMLNDGRNVFFVIESDGMLCGYIQVVGMNHLHGVGELGLCLDTQRQGKGLAGEALSLVETYVHDVFNIRKLTLHVLSDNIRAVRFYQKNGFHQIGVWRQHFYQAGEYKDVTLMEKFLMAENAP